MSNHPSGITVAESHIYTLRPKPVQGDFRVREHIIAQGTRGLGGEDLLMAILGHGVRGKRVDRLAKEIYAFIRDGQGPLDITALKSIIGMGNAKASIVAAALELGRRLYGAHGTRVRTPSDVFPLVAHFADLKQERFLTVSLNGAHEVIQTRTVSVGLVNRTLIHPREVFADALTDRACAIIVAHNHPSGQLTPSPEDKDITRRLRGAGELLGIPLLDHLVFSQQDFYSFVEHGLLDPAGAD